MMKRQVKVTEYTCDNDDCRAVRLISAPDDMLGIFGGPVSEHTTSGGGGATDWFACSRECIERAVTAVLDRRD